AGTLGANGWYTSDVTVSTTGSDPVSGPVTCTADQQQTTETTGAVFNGDCTNQAGLVGNAAPLTVKLDKTPPTATLAVTAGTLGANGWYTSDVTVSTTGSDPVSGPVTCTADQQQTTETTGAVFNGACTNQAGLVGNAAPLTVKLDVTPPTVGITGPAIVLQGTSASAVVTAYDATSGLAVDPSGSLALDTSTVGPHSVTVIATDNAGNSNSATLEYTVWGVNGPFAPVIKKGLGTGQFKAGSTIPVKFQLTDGANLVTTATGTITIGSASAAFRWDATSQQYIANVKTGTTIGTFLLMLSVGGVGSTDIASVNLR
ncbi:MAG: hypothetical protein HY677_07275, partial [Chloroflexi bacterium]|nr:hypothetical protein [Chloroflexota bacterium]